MKRQPSPRSTTRLSIARVRSRKRHRALSPRGWIRSHPRPAGFRPPRIDQSYPPTSERNARTRIRSAKCSTPSMRRRQSVRCTVDVSSGQDIHRAKNIVKVDTAAANEQRQDFVEEEGESAAGMPLVTGTDEKGIARHQFGDDERAPNCIGVQISSTPDSPFSVARGSGSSDVISVFSPPSRTARARNRVE